MRFWVTRTLAALAGWRLAMAYPLDDSVEQLAISLAVGTLGLVVVGFVAYSIGYERGLKTAAPSSALGGQGE